MKYVKQFVIIIAVTFLGELLHHVIPLPVPASIYGLVIMLFLLITGIVKIGHVKKMAEFLIEIMPMMFIPAGVGLLTAWDEIRPVLIPILIMTVVSTFLTMGVTGTVAQAVMRFRKRETSADDIEKDLEEAEERRIEDSLEDENE